jgi:hypothetical protein
MFSDFLNTFHKTFLILRIQRRIIIDFDFVRVKFSLFLSDVGHTLVSSAGFRTILKYQISSKSFKWEPNSSMRKLVVTFLNFWKSPKNSLIYPVNDMKTKKGGE